MRQHTSPVFISSADKALKLSSDKTMPTVVTRGYDEDFIRNLVFQHPELIPVNEIDGNYENIRPICKELQTNAGPIDAFMMTDTGRPVLVECKLWTNPQARREVVGQILDYAKELHNWSYEDLQRTANARLKDNKKSLYERVTGGKSGTKEEAEFIDSVTRNLRTGRFMLVIVGDGIREGVEAIGEYLTDAMGLQFAFGLVELPVYSLPDGLGHIATPRILAKTKVINRFVVTTAQENTPLNITQEASQTNSPTDLPASLESAEENQAFWDEFLAGLILDDARQEIPNSTKSHNVRFLIKTKTDEGYSAGNWITVYLARAKNLAGVYFSGSLEGLGADIIKQIASEEEQLKDALGANVWVSQKSDGRFHIGESFKLTDLSNLKAKTQLISTLQQRTNLYVNVFRPWVETLVRDMD